MVDKTITFKNIAVEHVPGESHILISDAGGSHGARNARPIDVIKESSAVGKLMEICQNDSERQDAAIKALEGAIEKLTDEVTNLVKLLKKKGGAS